MKFFKKTTAAVMCTALTLTSVPAFAAQADGTPDVSVQLNGEEINFTDASPVIENGRTYVPFRAVFDALGTDTIEYDATTKTITAVQGDTTVKFTIGKSEMELTKDGKTTTQAIDAATFIKNDRTYIPVRFAAQALACQVGWDDDFKTVVLLDKDVLLDGIDNQFTLMNQYAKEALAVQKANPGYTGTLNLKLKVKDDDTSYGITGTCDIKGKVDDTQSVVNSAVKLDLKDLEKALKAAEKLDEGSQDMIKALGSFNFDVVINTKDGSLYITSSLLSDMFSLADGTWFKLDLGDMLSQSGMNIDFSNLTNSTNYADVTKSTLDSVDINNSYAVAAAVETANMFKEAFSDEAFTKEGNNFVSNYTSTADGMTTSMKTTLYADSAEKVTGCKIEATTDMGELGKMVISADYKDLKTAVNVSFDMMDTVSASVDGTISLTKSVPTVNAPTSKSEVKDLGEIFAALLTTAE